MMHSQSLSKENHHYFMGYYDLKPISSGGEALVLNWSGDYPSRVNLCEWNINENSVSCIAEDIPLSWQLGNRQTYLMRDSLLAYHQQNCGEPIGVIWDREKRSMTEIEPFFAISQTGIYVPWDWLSYSRMRHSYGFSSLCKTSSDGAFDFNKQKIEIRDFNENSTRELLSYSELRDLLSTNEDYLIDHVQISPDGKSLAFIAKPINQGPGAASKFFVWRDLLGWNTLNSITQVSHFNFDDEGRIVVFGEQKRVLSRANPFLRSGYKLIRPFWQKYNKNGRLTNKVFNQMYFTIDTSNEVNPVVQLPSGSDGHPSLTSKFIITDTYPNANGIVSLIFCDLQKTNNTSVKKIDLKYDVNYLDGIDRVDLHPKIGRGEDVICVDRLVDNQRFVEAFSLAK